MITIVLKVNQPKQIQFHSVMYHIDARNAFYVSQVFFYSKRILNFNNCFRLTLSKIFFTFISKFDETYTQNT